MITTRKIIIALIVALILYVAYAWWNAQSLEIRVDDPGERRARQEESN